MAIDVNTTSRETLIALKGIGSEVADAIVQARPFNSIEDLLSIPGIGRATLKKLKAQGLTVVSQYQPFRVRLPLPISEDVGLGDVVKRVTSALHIRHCGGCESRRVWLNRRFVFTRHSVRS